MVSWQLVNKQAVVLDGKIFWLKIGLRGIIYLQGLPEYDESDVLIAALITPQELTVDEAKRLVSQQRQKLSSYLPSLFEQVSSFHFCNVRDLYSRAVGEIGINPAIFFQMSPDEIELAYKGYLRKKELEANLMKVAMLEALAGDHSQIKVLEPDEYTLGTLQEREQTFSEIGERI